MKTSLKLTSGSIGSALLISGLFIGGAAMAADDSAHQGLYSADELIGADVFAADNHGEAAAEVEDVLFDNDMQLAALVVESGSVLNADHRLYVIETGNFRVETHNGNSLDNMEYEVYLNLNQAQVSEQPEYTNTWWNNTKDELNQAWQSTQQGAQSAWQATKEATSNALDSAGSTMQELGNKIQGSADGAENVDSTENTAN